MNKRLLFIIPVICAVSLLFYIHTDGKTVIRQTNFREMDNISILFSRQTGTPFTDVKPDTREYMELCNMIENMHLVRHFDSYMYTDGSQHIRISAASSIVGDTSVISFHGNDYMSVYTTGGNTVKYRILNHSDFDILGYVENLFRQKYREESTVPRFTVTTDFPEGWKFVKRPPNYSSFDSKYIMSGLSFVHDIYDAENIHIGAIGCSKYRTTADHTDNPQAIYVSVGLPNDYHFSTVPYTQDGGYYATSATYEHGTSATTKVYYIPHFAKDAGYPEEEKLNDGILCYNSRLSVFVAMEFEEGLFTQQELETLADSTKIVLRQ